MPTSVGRVALYIGLPLSAAVLILTVCFVRRSRRAEERQQSSTKSHVVAKVTEEVQIPTVHVGYVIGRGGSRINKIQEENEVKVFFRDRSETDKDKEEKEGEEKTRTAIITGAPESVERAKTAILELVAEKESQPEPQTMVIAVPTRMVGRIIGKQGSMIRQLQNESKARILVERASNPDSMQTQVTITGQPADIDRACCLLKELLEQPDRRPGAGGMAPPPPFSAPPFKPHLQPAVLPDGVMPVNVYASAIDEDCSIWVQVVGPELDELSKMVEEMTRLCPQEGKLLRQPFIGDHCAACFEIDGCWYRARLQFPGQGGRWNVLFVDYGDVGTCLVSELKEMRQEHSQLKCQAIKCQLAHITPAKDSLPFLEALDEVSLCALWKPLQLVVVDAGHNPPLVSLRSDTDSDESYDVATELVARGVAVWSVVEEGVGDGREREEEEEAKVERNIEEEQEEEEETQDVSLQFDSAASDEGGEDELPASLALPSGRRLVDICASTDDKDALGHEEARQEKEGEEGEEGSYWLHKEDVTTAGKYFISGTAEYCPVTVEWAGQGCKEVCVAGSFTDWKKQPLTERSAGVFSDVFQLPVGEHQLRFLVDGSWQHSSALPISEQQPQAEGGVTNCLGVERLEADSTAVTHTPSDRAAVILKEEEEEEEEKELGGLAPPTDEASGGNTSVSVSTSSQDGTLVQQSAVHVNVTGTVGSNPTDLI